MGLFHLGYEANLRALLDGLTLFQRENPSVEVTLTLRCEHVRPQVIAGSIAVTVLPFSDETQVERDMEQADILYLPLPFGAQHENFARHSLSTKMITYVGSGLPILYHGPTTSAAFEILHQHRAAIHLTSLVPAEIAAMFDDLTAETRETVAANALALAKRDFMLTDQRRKFWGAITQSLETA
jgi:hypothetical protein